MLRRKYKADKILTEEFIQSVHERMLGDVWAWAGQLRMSEKTIGIPWYQIPVRLGQLLDNCKYWVDNKTFSDEEISIRFKHDLVAIHLFPNGNGRHSRLLGDIMMKQVFKKPKFSWGHKNLIDKGKTRDAYIKALQKGDLGDFQDLIDFAQS